MRTIITRLPRYAPTLIKSTRPPITTITKSRPFTMSLTNNSSHPSAAAEEQPETPNNAPKAPLALPAAPSNPTHQLDMSTGGSTVSLDHLGPMVVNVDGTMSRISNWDKMAEIEKKNTLRIIGKRNQERLAALKKDGALEEEGEK